MYNILVTGGTGRLAAELKKHLPDATFVSIEDYDIAYIVAPQDKFDVILHMAAFTNVFKAESESRRCFDTNVYGTYNLVNAYKDTPFVYISTEYANKPLGVYALTKRLGEEVVKTHPQHLILRTSFKPNPFPFEYAYSDQYTQGDYVDVIAKMLADRVKKYLKKIPKLSSLEYLGTGRKTMYQLAVKTRPNVKKNKVKDYNEIIGMKLIPHDY